MCGRQMAARLEEQKDSFAVSRPRQQRDEERCNYKQRIRHVDTRTILVNTPGVA